MRYRRPKREAGPKGASCRASEPSNPLPRGAECRTSSETNSPSALGGDTLAGKSGGGRRAAASLRRRRSLCRPSGRRCGAWCALRPSARSPSYRLRLWKPPPTGPCARRSGMCHRLSWRPLTGKLGWFQVQLPQPLVHPVLTLDHPHIHVSSHATPCPPSLPLLQ